MCIDDIDQPSTIRIFKGSLLIKRMVSSTCLDRPIYVYFKLRLKYELLINDDKKINNIKKVRPNRFRITFFASFY